MSINGRSKGAGGEREFCDWLESNFSLDFKPTRNLDQTREGGADVLCVRPFVFEVKRTEGISRRQWWVQVCEASNDGDIPVVAYRPNRQPWRFLISAKNIGLQVGFIQLEEHQFKEWALLRHEKFHQMMKEFQTFPEGEDSP